jgi:hypothetical protein
LKGIVRRWKVSSGIYSFSRLKKSLPDEKLFHSILPSIQFDLRRDVANNLGDRVIFWRPFKVIGYLPNDVLSGRDAC